MDKKEAASSEFEQRPKRRAAPAKEKKKDYYLRVLAVQTAVCTVMTAGVGALKKINASAFDSLKAGYDSIMEADGNPVGEAVKTFFGEEIAVHAAALVELEQDETPDAGELIKSFKIETVKNSLGNDIKVVTDKNLTARAIGIREEAVKPVEGELTSDFAWRDHPINGINSFHAGIDIAAAEGTQIKCAFDGTVYKAGTDSSFGNYIIVEHEGGFKSVYAHCKKVIMTEGDSVSAGDTIALVGSTGQSTGSHLHFELRAGEDNIRFNPAVIIDV